VVGWQGFKRPDLARPQGLLWPRAISSHARRYLVLKWLAPAGLPRVLAESDADPVAVPPVRNLIKLRDSQNIRGALFDYELSEPDEYFRFGSDHVPPAGRHVFMCSVQDNRLVIKRHDVKFDAEAFFFGEGNAAGRCSAQLKIIVSGTKRDPPLSSRENPARMSVLPQADLGAGNPQ
jgi:hypothetical protein